VSGGSRFRWTAVPRVLGLLAGLAAFGPALCENIDPDQDGSQFAWGENVGWVNAEPSGPGGPGLEVGEFDVSGWMWGENIGWISFSCENTGSCGVVEYGVTHDGGILSGWAWSENAGWISLSCANTGSCAAASYGVVIDTTTGEFSGRAWGENVGWITFASPRVPYKVKTSWTCTVPAAVTGLKVKKSGADVEVSWAPTPGATAYDVVRGDLGKLRATGGDFSVATVECVAEKELGTSTVHAGSPGPGEGHWFLTRAANCGGGTYDSGGAQQAAPRDAGIEGSGAACP